MNCKNCEHPLSESAHFCVNCGAKVIQDRITFKALLVDVFINVFGIDSKFFLTLRMAARKPHILVEEVIGGVRKRYMNPFAFLAVGAAISLLVFNYFSDDFKAVNSEINAGQVEEYKKKANLDIASIKGISKKEKQKLEFEKKGAQLQLKILDGMMNFMLQFYNLLAFVFVFIYAVLSKWTFWKPHNFGEHIVINAYFFGFTTYLSLILFFLSMLVHPSIYMYSILIYIIYYMFAFGKIYDLSIWKNTLKLFRFLLGLTILFLAIVIVGFLVGVVLAYLGYVKM
ncbi:DUF3667 domain-containing protein [Polaribacter sp. R77954]|uniref:DUF3667 domain-containing protein n=1 Tax=Polaribacter sp. R77954 TaxID=3093870 RepID=UPI0037C5EB0A